MSTDKPKANRWAHRQNLALIGLALLLALLLGGGIVYQHGGFAALKELYFLADDVTALTPGTTVRLSGFRVGSVASMELQPDLKVRVVLNVDADAFGYLRSDARAELVREQLKPAAIDLRAGSATLPLSEKDPRVAFGRRGTLTEVAEDLRARLAPILADVKQLTGTAVSHKADLDAVIANSRRLSQQLADTATEIHALSSGLRERLARVGGQSEQAMAEANRSLVRIGGLIGRAEQSLDSVNSRLPGLLQRTDSTLANLEGVMRDVRSVSAVAATEAPVVLRGVPPLLDDTREIVQGVRGSWPIRSVLAAPPPALLPIDSHDSQVLRDPAAR